MTKHHNYLLSLMLTTAFALGDGSNAAAQDAKVSNRDNGGEATGDIIVTARRSEEWLKDVPISITVLSQGD